MQETMYPISPLTLQNIGLKADHCVAVFQPSGDMPSGHTGMYLDSMRHIRAHVLTANFPLAVSTSNVNEKCDQARIILSNWDPKQLTLGGSVASPTTLPDTLRVARNILLSPDGMQEQFTIHNYGSVAAEVVLELTTGAGFEDLFAIRGAQRQEKWIGKAAAPELSGNKKALWRYTAVDGAVLSTEAQFQPEGLLTGEKGDVVTMVWSFSLNPGDETVCRVNFKFTPRNGVLSVPRGTATLLMPASKLAALIHTSNESVNQMLRRGWLDYCMLQSSVPGVGYVPIAGLPWFQGRFARDDIFTSLFILPWYPLAMKWVLIFLLLYQGIKLDSFREEQPGKIFHEYSTGEANRLGELPFGPSYASHDATPLLVYAAGQYLRWTNDSSFLAEIYGKLVLACHWLETYADLDGDGLQEYKTGKGLGNQNWRDSYDGIPMADGSYAVGVIACCEQQAYAFGAFEAMSYIAERVGDKSRAAHYRRQAATIQKLFLSKYWWEAEGTYHLALVGEGHDKVPTNVVTTNPGHCLWMGIAPEEHAVKIMQRLLQPDVYSGWGLRGLSSQAIQYNPSGYHHAVWMHDTAVNAWGCANYGMKGLTAQLFRNATDASLFYPYNRLPEVLGGDERRPGEAPVPYSTACSPQLWDTVIPQAYLQALLGLEADAEHNLLIVRAPWLPDWMNEVTMTVKVGQHDVVIHCQKRGNDVAVSLVGRSSVSISKM